MSMLEQLKIVQNNLKKCKSYTDQLIKYVNDHKLDVIALQEPYAFSKDSEKFYRVTGFGSNFNVFHHRSQSEIPKSAIAIRKNIDGYMLDQENTDRNRVVVVFKDLVLISIYFNPNEADNSVRDIKPDLLSTQNVIDKYADKRMVICCDSNARNVLFGDDKSNQRGMDFLNFIICNEFQILNDKEQGPTFNVQTIVNDIPICKKSYIDLTLAKNIQSDNTKWSNLKGITNSDHNTILITISSQAAIYKYSFVRKTINVQRSNWNGFLDHYNSHKPSVNIEQINKSNFDAIFSSFDNCIEDASIRFLEFNNNKIYDNTPWYRDYLEKTKNQITFVRRKISKTKNTVRILELRLELSELNKFFKIRVREEKKNFFLSIHKVTNTEQFWKLWKRTKQCNAQNIPLFENNASRTLEENESILMNHFVKEPKFPYKKLEVENRDSLAPTNSSELQTIINNLKPNKAPGLDNVTNRLIKIIFANDKEYIASLYNLILHKIKIPNRWKVGKMIFFAKNKVINTPKDLRPITLISGWCKIAECLINKRLEDRLNQINFFNPNQFGFTRNKSTVDAIENVMNTVRTKTPHNRFNLLMSVDISGAFDNIKWDMIIKNLLESKIELKYIKAVETVITNRKCLINENQFDLKKGTPQGGCMSPLLWRIGMNKLLNELDKFKKTNNTAFADDLITLVSTNSEKELEECMNQTYAIVNRWCECAELKININKTQLMLLGNKKLKTQIRLQNTNVNFVNKIKYLGLVIDKNLTWKNHLDHLELKANLLMIRLNYFSFLNSNIELSHKTRLYFSVFLPTVLYAYRCWYPHIKDKITYIERLRILQRRFLKMLVRAYKCTNTDKLLKLLQIVDIVDEIRILEEANNLPKEARKDYKNENRAICLSRIDNCDFRDIATGRLTHRFTLWCLTDTGPFKEFLCKINKASDPFCRYCNSAFENPSHILYDCIRFKDLEFENLEARCIHIVKQLFKDNHLIEI